MPAACAPATRPSSAPCAGATRTTCCTSTCNEYGPRCRFDAKEFEKGYHSLSCGCNSYRLIRHEGCLDWCTDWFLRRQKCVVNKKHVSCHVDSGKRVDAILFRTYAAAKNAGLDVTIVCPACPTYITLPAAHDATHVTGEKEKEKAAKHKAACEAHGMDYLTACWTTYGGWGKEFVKRFFNPFYKTLKAQEVAEGGSGFEAIEEKHRDMNRLSICLARSNAKMVGATAQEMQGQGNKTAMEEFPPDSLWWQPAQLAW